jgi:hypothetical protein
MPTVEEVTYDAARTALADQDAVVTGIRQRTGTLLAATALVASFLGATTVKAKGLHGAGWAAVVVLVLGLAVAAVLLANWKLSFAIDARQLYGNVYPDAAAEAEDGTLTWLVRVAYTYQELRERNARRVELMSILLTALGVLMVLQTLLWLLALR